MTSSEKDDRNPFIVSDTTSNFFWRIRDALLADQLLGLALVSHLVLWWRQVSAACTVCFQFRIQKHLCACMRDMHDLAKVSAHVSAIHCAAARSIIKPAVGILHN